MKILKLNIWNSFKEISDKIFGKKKLIKYKEPSKTATCLMCNKEKENDGHMCCEDCGGIAF